MNSSLSKAIAVGFMIGIGAAGGCSPGNTGHDPHEQTGTVGVRLTIPGGETLDTVSWQVLSGTTVIESGQVNLADSQTVSFIVGGLTAGTIRST
jgi:hypothetical protein